MKYFYIDEIKDPNYNFVKKTIFSFLIIFIVLPVAYYLYSSITKDQPLWSIPIEKNGLNAINSITKSKKGYLLTTGSSRGVVKIIEIDEKGKEIWNKKFTSQGHMSSLGIETNENFIISYQEKYNNSVFRKSGVTKILDKKNYRVLAKIPYFFKSIALCEKGFLGFAEDNKIFRFDENGKEIWEKEIFYDTQSKSFTQRFMNYYNKEGVIKRKRLPDIRFKKVIKTSDNNYILIAREPFLMMKINKEGDVIWKNDFTDSFSGEFIDIIELKDKSFLSLIYIYPNKLSKVRKGGIGLTKISSVGKIEWSNELISKNDLPFTRGFKPFKKNKYFFSAHDINNKSRSINNFFVIDKNGIILEEKSFDIKGSSEAIISSIISMDDGGVLLGGYAYFSKKVPFTIGKKTYETTKNTTAGLLYKIPPTKSFK
ncbi:hypothetical protein ACMC56_01330 [Campylobacterota bacterium DY0563]